MDKLERFLTGYEPADAEEARVKEEAAEAYRRSGTAVLSRGSGGHVTATAFVVNETGEKTLVVRHKLYGALCPPGGHADGEEDLLSVALRETEEETGVKAVPLSGVPVSLDFLPVPEHEKNGERVAPHRHLAFTFAFTASEKQTLRACPAENDGAEWTDTARFLRECPEKRMLPVYRKCLERIGRLRREKERLLALLPGRLLPWYAVFRRDLPWRGTRDPYRILVSEVMLQQTRAETVRGYYERFVRRLPDLNALASCGDDELYKLWEGLGYYSRARNLRAAAQTVLSEFGGVFPDSAERLKRLPGVGDYTAGAVASIAFGRRTAAVDGNVLRVTARLTECFADVSGADYRKELARKLGAVYPEGACGDFTQSLMELGATVCLPGGAPACECCPLSGDCLAFRHGTAARLPSKRPKAARRVESRTVFVLRTHGTLAVLRRPERGLLAGLWELPNADGFLSADEASEWLTRHGAASDGALEQRCVKHIFTHVEWRMRVYETAVSSPSSAFVWADAARLKDEIALPAAFKRCLTS